MSNIFLQSGNLLRAEAEVLVNTVNCVGVMGKGIALQFDRTFPENSRFYKEACKANLLHAGEVLVWTRQLELDAPLPVAVANFATKDHWRGKSKIQWIEKGLAELVRLTRQNGWKSLAIPPLGCGAGGLDWREVRPLIEAAFADLPAVKVLLYAPEGAPRPEEIPAPAQAPHMTVTAALYIRLLARYSAVDLEFSHLEFQKLAYFLQEAGEPSRWVFEAKQYGPAADGPFQMLRRWDGHWTFGFGDGTGGPLQPMMLNSAIIEEAEIFLSHNATPDSEARVAEVLALIEGMDTASGLELLASIHWIARHHPEAIEDKHIAANYFQSWNEHKRRDFSIDWVYIAWERLHQRNWMENLAPANSHKS